MGTSFDFSKSTIGVDWQQFRTQTLLTPFNSVDVQEGEQHGYPDEDQDFTYTSDYGVHERDTYNEPDPFDPNSDFNLAGSFTYKYDISNLHPTRFYNDDPDQPVWWYWTETVSWLHYGSDTITSFNNFVIDGVQVNVILNGYYQYGAPYQATYSDALGKSVGYFETALQGFYGSDFADTFILGSQDDVLYAGDGADTINGNGGVDFLDFGYEDGAVDTVIYDSLADVSTDAVYYNADHIQSAGLGDRIDFSAIGGLHFIEKIQFSGRAGEYRFSGNNGGSGTVQFDTDGDGQTDQLLYISFDTDARTASLNQSALGSNILVVGAPSTDIVAPAIQSVSIPNAPLNIGDTATATLTVASDIDTYALSTGSIAGYALSNFVKVNATTYTAQFTVTEGGTEFAASASVPVNIVLRDTAGNVNTAYTGAITQTLDAIDGKRPELISGTVRGDKVVLTFNEALGSPGPTTSDITVMVGGVQREAGSFTVSGATITLTLSQAVTPGQTVTLSFSEMFDANNNDDNYAAPQDLAGNDADAFSLTLSNITSGTPTAGNDVLVGTEGPDTIDGLAGNDQISGLGGNDTLLGGLGNDMIDGGSGADYIDGGAGADTMIGGDGADIYIVDNAGDVVIEGSGVNSGYDIVISTVNYTLSANVEQLVLQGGATTGTGNDTANYLYGGLSGLSLTLNGAGGDDVLYAGLAGGNTMNGGSGVDTLLLYGGNNQANGGTGSDIYYTYTASDVISEAGGDGIDTVYSNHSITIAEDIEQVILFGSATSATSASLDDNNIIYGNSTSGAVSLSGGGGADVLFGGAFNDTLSGGAGVDLLFAFGGANTLIGGADTDVYYLESGLDTVTETLTGGFDTIYTQAAGTTALAANVEQLILYGAATGGLGNGAANYLYGHIASQAVTLDGAGGNDYLLDSVFGGDVLTGGAGNDLLDLRTGGNDFIKFAASGSNADLVYGFDANPAGGQDIIDVSGRGFSAGSIGSSIIISAAGADTLVTIGADTIQFIGVVSTDISANDFLF